MKLITLRSQALEVMPRWRKQYPDPAFTFADGKTVAERTKLLEVVNWHTVPPEQIAAIMGNDSWCHANTCNECGVDSDVVIEIGEPPHYKSHTATLCRRCVEQAMAHFRGQA